MIVTVADAADGGERRGVQPAAVLVLRADADPARRCARPPVNRIGARIVGIRPASTATLAFLLASLLGAISGILIGPVTTLYYDSGFIIGLKAFVGAIIGGLVELSRHGDWRACSIGVLESFASFWNSSFKEVMVFSVLIPVLLVALAVTRHTSTRKTKRSRDEPLRSSIVLALVAIAMLATAPFWAASVHHHSAQLYRHLRAGRARPRAADRRRRADIVWAGGVRRHRRLRTAWLTTADGVSPWLGLLFALACDRSRSRRSLGAVTLRLGGHYLPLGTIAWGLAIYFLFGNIDALGGHNGLTDVPPIYDRPDVARAEPPRSII